MSITNTTHHLLLPGSRCYQSCLHPPLPTILLLLRASWIVSCLLAALQTSHLYSYLFVGIMEILATNTVIIDSDTCAPIWPTPENKKRTFQSILFCVCVWNVFLKEYHIVPEDWQRFLPCVQLEQPELAGTAKWMHFFIGDNQLEVFSFSVPMNASTSAVPKAAVKLSPMAKCDHGTFRSHNQWLLYNQSHSDHQHVLQAGIHSLYFWLVFSTNEVSWQKKIKWICDRHSWYSGMKERKFLTGFVTVLATQLGVGGGSVG